MLAPKPSVKMKPLETWYDEPEQRFMRGVVLHKLRDHMAGYSGQALVSGLNIRGYDTAHAWQLLTAMLGEGVVIRVDGVEIEIEETIPADGRLEEPSTTTNTSLVERPVLVYRLSAARWLKGVANGK